MFIKLSIVSLISVIISLSGAQNSPVTFFVSKNDITDACMLLKLSATLKLSSNKNEVTGYLNSKRFNNATVKANGNCSDKINVMNFSWYALENNSTRWSISLEVENLNGKSFKLMNSNLNIEAKNYSLFNLSDVSLDLKGDIITKEFSINKNFICKSKWPFKFSGKNNNTDYMVTLETEFIQFQAFRGKSNNGDFTGDEEQCTLDMLERNIVPLIVGGILTGMIIIVIITYLIGRRRHRANYQTI